MSFPAFFDTNVPYGALLNDFILELADRGLFRPLWSKDVLVELTRSRRLPPMCSAGPDRRFVVRSLGWILDAEATGGAT